MQLRKEWVLPASIGVVSFTVGTIVGYIYAQRRSVVSIISVVDELDVEVLTPEQEEHESIVTEYDAPFRTKVMLEGRDPIAEQRAVEEIVREERAEAEMAKIQEAQANGAGAFNIFAGNEDDWDYEEELAKRTPDKPYIIHRDEFESNEGENSQSSLTYYALDDVLCDDQEVPIYNHGTIVGELIFGKGSKDISIVYVRNEKLGSEWEIIIDHGSYQAEVLGEEIAEQFEEGDIKHSRAPRKFREDE